MSEATLQRKIQKAIRDRGAWCVKFPGGPHGKAGTPDLLICFRGHFIGIEVKQPGKKATQLQGYVLDKIKDAGGKAAVCSSVDEAHELLDEIWRRDEE